jgi:hypothetical protein
MIPIATLEALLREGAISKEVYDRLMASSSVTRRRRGEIEADLLDLGADPSIVKSLYDACETLTSSMRGKIRPSNGRAIHSVRVWILHEDALDRAEASKAPADPGQVTAADPATASTDSATATASTDSATATASTDSATAPAKSKKKK